MVMDATFFTRSYGILVVRCPKTKNNLYWKEVIHELPLQYQKARKRLEQAGYMIQAVVLDGKRGVREVFEDIPVQMCHFHQIQIVKRYITSRPKLPAGQELRAITLALPILSEKTFSSLLSEWYERWKCFLQEKTFTEDKKHWYYTHRKIRSAYRSLMSHLPYLFTYQHYPELNIPNTTNSLDGYFHRLKDLLRVHRGLTPKRRYKMIQEILSW